MNHMYNKNIRLHEEIIGGLQSNLNFSSHERAVKSTRAFQKKKLQFSERNLDNNIMIIM